MQDNSIPQNFPRRDIHKHWCSNQTWCSSGKKNNALQSLVKSSRQVQWDSLKARLYSHNMCFVSHDKRSNKLRRNNFGPKQNAVTVRWNFVLGKPDYVHRVFKNFQSGFELSNSNLRGIYYIQLIFNLQLGISVCWKN